MFKRKLKIYGTQPFWIMGMKCCWVKPDIGRLLNRWRMPKDGLISIYSMTLCTLSEIIYQGIRKGFLNPYLLKLIFKARTLSLVMCICLQAVPSLYFYSSLMTFWRAYNNVRVPVILKYKFNHWYIYFIYLFIFCNVSLLS